MLLVQSDGQTEYYALYRSAVPLQYVYKWAIYSGYVGLCHHHYCLNDYLLIVIIVVIFAARQLIGNDL